MKATSAQMYCTAVPQSCFSIIHLSPSCSSTTLPFHLLSSRVRVHLRPSMSASSHSLHTTAYHSSVVSATTQPRSCSSAGGGGTICLTYLPLPTGHSNVHEPPGVGDSLLSAAFRSAMELDHRKEEETEGRHAFSSYGDDLVKRSR